MSSRVRPSVRCPIRRRLRSSMGTQVGASVGRWGPKERPCQSSRAWRAVGCARRMSCRRSRARRILNSHRRRASSGCRSTPRGSARNRRRRTGRLNSSECPSSGPRAAPGSEAMVPLGRSRRGNAPRPPSDRHSRSCTARLRSSRERTDRRRSHAADRVYPRARMRATRCRRPTISATPSQADLGSIPGACSAAMARSAGSARRRTRMGRATRRRRPSRSRRCEAAWARSTTVLWQAPSSNRRVRLRSQVRSPVEAGSAKEAGAGGSRRARSHRSTRPCRRRLRRQALHPRCPMQSWALLDWLDSSGRRDRVGQVRAGCTAAAGAKRMHAAPLVWRNPGSGTASRLPGRASSTRGRPVRCSTNRGGTRGRQWDPCCFAPLLSERSVAVRTAARTRSRRTARRKARQPAQSPRRRTLPRPIRSRTRPEHLGRKCIGRRLPSDTTVAEGGDLASAPRHHPCCQSFSTPATMHPGTPTTADWSREWTQR